MTVLKRGALAVESVFAIYGDDENNMSAGFAYVLSQSDALLQLVIEDLIPGLPYNAADAIVNVQSSHKDEGITDVEIVLPGQAFIVFEAKKGMVLPAEAQLRQYTPRSKRSDCSRLLLVAMTAIDNETASVMLGASDIDGVPLTCRSWCWLRGLLVKATFTEKSHHVRWIISEYRSYLEGFMGHDRVFSNMVYVVSLAHGTPDGWNASWIDIVEKYDRYFYPVGGRSWPPPPNYIGFRYDGRLQSIRHIKYVELVPDVRKCFPGSEAGIDWGSHYLFTLGPPIKPGRVVRTGSRVQHSARVWCMLDTLLTCDTISDALTETETRRKAANVV